MVKAVSASYITQENRNQGARFVTKITYQKSAATQIDIPPSEVISAPSINNSIGTGNDFFNLSGGEAQLTLDNSKRQWDETYSGAYRKALYNGEIRIWAGFTLSSGNNEYLNIYSGKITNIVMNAVAPYNAEITTQNKLVDEISKGIIGAPSTDGTLNPYISGDLQRARLINLSAGTPNRYYFQYKGTVNWDAYSPVLYKRRDGISDEYLPFAGSYNVSTNLKRVTFVQATPGNLNYLSSIHKNFPTTNIPTVIRSILLNELSIPSTHINATSLNRVAAVQLALRQTPSTTSFGIQFYEQGAREAINKLCKICYAAAFIEGYKFTMVSLGSPVSSGISLTDTDYTQLSILKDTSRIINKVKLFYNRFPLLSNIATKTNATSVASYGVRSLKSLYSDFHYTYYDEIVRFNFNSASFFLGLANTIVRTNAHEKKIFNLSGVFSKGLRLELGDKVRISNKFFDINQASAVVVGKEVDFNRRRTNLSLLSWP